MHLTQAMSDSAIEALDLGVRSYHSLKRAGYNSIGEVAEAVASGKELGRLKKEYGCERLTVQSGGTVNGLLLREKLLDYVDIVVAPVLIGGKDTSTLIDGQSIKSCDELSGLGVLKLEECLPLSDSYIRLKYKVVS